MIEQPSIKEAAIILKSLPQEHAERVLARLDRDSQRRLHSTMAQSKTISAHDVSLAADQLLADSGTEFVVDQDKAEDKKKKRWRGAYERRKVDRRAGVRSGQPDRRKRADSKPFDFLERLDDDLVVRLLEVEHPINIAQVILTLDPAFASMIMRGLDLPLRISVMRRLCEVEEIDQVKLMELRYELKMRANKVNMIESYTRKGVDVASDLLSLADERTQKSLIAYMNQTDPDLKEYLEMRTISIQDIAKLTDTETKVLLQRVDTSAWAPALRAATLSVQQKVIKNMVPAAGEILSSEMAEFDPLDEPKIQDATFAVIRAILDLRKRGRITSIKVATGSTDTTGA
jgi:flagellar motor switch protein FliG